MKLDQHYLHPRLVALYDLENAWSRDNEFYLKQLPKTPCRVLDLGCGTGINAIAYAKLGHQVTGLEPSEAMLDVARRKPQAHLVQWVQAPAQNFVSNQHFDAIIMTGHTFQVFLERAEVVAVLKMMKHYLASQGKILFETRNPFFDWESRWQFRYTLETQIEKIKVERVCEPRQAQVLSFTTTYHFKDETLSSKSRLKFWQLEELDSIFRELELHAQAVYGDWSSQPFDFELSPEMIFVLRAK